MENHKTFEYFAICPPGLEDLLKAEIEQKIESIKNVQITQISKDHGGVTLYSAEENLEILNNVLKIPTRILKRITSFKCRDFPKLFNKLTKINWNEFVLSTDVNFAVSAKNSRLIHTKRIEQTAIKAFKKYRNGNQVKEKYNLVANKFGPQTLYINISDDIVTLSHDTTGERLNIRGERVLISKAPIRENIASALVFHLKSYFKENKILLEPMAGSAVFTIESNNFFKINNRDFAYQFTKKFINENAEFQNTSEKLFEEYIVNEIDTKVFDTFEMNLKKQKINFASFNKDYKDLQLTKEVCLVCNLPYGKRIKVENLNQFYKDFSTWCNNNVSINGIGILYPTNMYSNLSESFTEFDVKSKLKFKNGGINVYFTVLKRKGLRQNKLES